MLIYMITRCKVTLGLWLFALSCTNVMEDVLIQCACCAFGVKLDPGIINTLYYYSWGVLRFGFDRGVPLARALKSLPILRVILTEKGIHSQGFFSKYRSIFSKFSGVCNNSLKNGKQPMFRDIFVENGTHI